MSFLKSIIFGRPNGIRRGLFRRFFSKESDLAEDTSPSSSYSAPDQGVVAGGSVKLEPPKDITPPDGYEVVLHKDALKNNEVTEVIVAGSAIVLARLEDEFYAAANTCPHAGGPLADGMLDGSVLSCPYHGWGFDLKDGSCQTNPSFSMETYDVQIEGDGVCVRI